MTNTLGSTSISPSWRYQKVHISCSLPATSSRLGSSSSSQSRGVHGPAATTTCSAAIGPDEVSTLVAAPDPSSTKPVTSTPSSISAPAARAFEARPSIDSRLNAKPPRLSCRQTLRPGARQSGEQAAHVRRHLGLARDQLRLVADPLLALEDRAEVVLLGAVAERDVARAVVGERLGVRLPDVHAGGHQLLHGRLEVVVAHDAAGDPGRAGRHAGLVHHEHLLAALGEVPGGREPVDACAYDEGADGPRGSLSGRAAPSPRARAASSSRRPCGCPPPRARARAVRTSCASPSGGSRRSCPTGDG